MPHYFFHLRGKYLSASKCLGYADLKVVRSDVEALLVELSSAPMIWQQLIGCARESQSGRGQLIGCAGRSQSGRGQLIGCTGGSQSGRGKLFSKRGWSDLFGILNLVLLVNLLLTSIISAGIKLIWIFLSCLMWISVKWVWLGLV